MLLVLIGFCVGATGTLIGVGGGFLLIPVLLYLYPEASNVWISSVSMFVVAMNASSGSATYYFQRRVHLRAAVTFMMASFPGSIVGVWAEHFISRSAFELAFGIAMMVFALLIFFRHASRAPDTGIDAHSPLPKSLYIKGCIISFFVGFLASFFGIGGGIIHVPLLSNMLSFPVHLATGTSHMILAVTAWFTTLLHFYQGDIHIDDPAIWKLGLAALVGAQVGARASSRVSGKMILRLLAVALFFLGFRLTWAYFSASGR